MLLNFPAPLTVILAKRFSFRSVAFAGGIFVGCGYFLSGFVKEMKLMYLTFTVVGKNIRNRNIFKITTHLRIMVEHIY